MDIRGFDLKPELHSRPAKSPADCQARCQASETCRAFTWPGCHLKSSSEMAVSTSYSVFIKPSTSCADSAPTASDVDTGRSKVSTLPMPAPEATCESLGWDVLHARRDHATICARALDCSPGSISDAAAACGSVGARLCGINELIDGVAHSSGCAPGSLAWSSTACEHDLAICDETYHGSCSGIMAHSVPRSVAYYGRSPRCLNSSIDFAATICCTSASREWFTTDNRRLGFPASAQPSEPLVRFPANHALALELGATHWQKWFPPLPCDMQGCFDLTRCDRGRPFKVFVYEGLYFSHRRGLFANVLKAIRHSHFATQNAEEACMFVVNANPNELNIHENAKSQILNETDHSKWVSERVRKAIVDAAKGQDDVPPILGAALWVEAFNRYLASLPHWGGTGKNHLFIHFDDADDVQWLVDAPFAMWAMASASASLKPCEACAANGESVLLRTFREGFDVSVGLLASRVHHALDKSQSWRDTTLVGRSAVYHAAVTAGPHRERAVHEIVRAGELRALDAAPMLTTPRRLFASFKGRDSSPHRWQLLDLATADDISVHIIPGMPLNQLDAVERFQQCGRRLKSPASCFSADETEPYTSLHWLELLLSSTFSLCPEGGGKTSFRVGESLAMGAVPLIISDGYVMPFTELWEEEGRPPWAFVVAWKQLPSFLEALRSLNASTISAMQASGRQFYDTFYTTQSTWAHGLLELLARRIKRLMH